MDEIRTNSGVTLRVSNGNRWQSLLALRLDARGQRDRHQLQVQITGRSIGYGCGALQWPSKIKIGCHLKLRCGSLLFYFTGYSDTHAQNPREVPS